MGRKRKQSMEVKSDFTDGQEMISVRGARVHNLRDLNVDIPRDAFVVFTGVSGSGKSSLVFDTVFAEGQRRYLESLSVYARQYLDQLQRADVDIVEGLPPTISIDQRGGSMNPRSTVATVTEIYDYMRVLWARLGVAYCWKCDEPIRQQSPEQIVDRTMSLGEGRRVLVLAPWVRGRKGRHAEVFEKIRKTGLLRVRVDGEFYEVEEVPDLAPNRIHTIDAVVDRVIVREDIRTRLKDAISAALKLGDETVIICYEEKEKKSRNKKVSRQRKTSKRSQRSVTSSLMSGVQWQDWLFSSRWACPKCSFALDELAPRSFSFNSPYGACPSCEGLGYHWAFDPDLVFPDLHRTLSNGAVGPWCNARGRTRAAPLRWLKSFAEQHALEWKTPLIDFSRRLFKKLTHGDSKSPGVLALLQDELDRTQDDERYNELVEYMGPIACDDCEGTRLGIEGRSVLVAEKPIYQITAMTVENAKHWFEQLVFDGDDAIIAEPVLKELRNRLTFLSDVGLGYLSLDRRANTLSGGESQRIRLAAQLGAGLIGVCYILDEPTIGLHPRDNHQLLDALENLKDQGNSVLVVEHDEETMRRADYVMDIGPGAGIEGGKLVAAGSIDNIISDGSSVTGQYLSGERVIAVPSTRRDMDPGQCLSITGINTNNLKNLTVKFPLGHLIVVTGVSGSGKSSLVNETLARAVARVLQGKQGSCSGYSRIKGAEQIEKLVEIDQSPIGRTPRSNPATYTGVFDEVRGAFSKTRESRLRGYKAGRFSFNVRGGRCESCKGHGTRKMEMHFLPDIYVPCEVCHGARFNRQTLEIRYRGKSIADVLQMRVDEARSFFSAFPRLFRLLTTLQNVGLGYLTLGQSSTTLSGGESQRIKLAADLGKTSMGKTLYLLDEPTTGLHFSDIEKLLQVLGELVDRGNTVVVIEHNLDVIKCADYLIDLGPGAGDDGGTVVACGSPEEVVKHRGSQTAKFLREVLSVA